ncbi:MAG: ribonuclease III [Pseudomonadales bacterium]|nr:ribonuclease III [Pseudomonadales bacterium]
MNNRKARNYPRLFKRIGYTFSDIELFEHALTHRSVSGKHNNERLEFLGDSILGMIIAEDLYQRFETAKEGELTRLRSRIVRGKTLAEIGKELELGEFLKLGGGERKSGGHRRESTLSDTVEAIIGAVYLEAGLKTCREMVLGLFNSRLEALDLTNLQKDPKTRLQEFLQSRKLSVPDYQVISATGEAHDQTFEIECLVEGLPKKLKGAGTSRRAAEQQAAAKALAKLGQE